MVQSHRFRELGIAYESVKGTDPIGSGDDYYKLGYRVRSLGKFPKPKYNIASTYRGSRDPTLEIASADLTGTLAFAPVNAIAWYLALGSSATAAGVHTITGIDSGELPYFTTRFETSNDTENIRKSMTGTKLKTLNFELTRLNENVRFPAMMGINVQGTGFGAPTYPVTNTPIYPDSVSDMFYKDSNFYFTWYYGGDNLDYKSDVMNFTGIIDMTNQFLPLLQQLFPEEVSEGTRAHILRFNILRGNDTSIYDDFAAQDRDTTGMDLRVKIHQTASKYLQLDYSNIFLQECEINDQNEAKNEDGIYEVVGIAESLTVKSNDGLTAATFYGE